MQDLTPVGLSQDGRRLLLASSSGEEFAVPVDARLRAALRGENARLGQLEMKMESALRPRDIQARIRAGESPEEVAAAAQTTVEAIMGFATPVLAERAHVARTAQGASIRRRSGESSSAGRSLAEAAQLFFSGHKLHDEDVSWDAWRRPDGRWALQAEFTIDGTARTAEFSHDLPGRYVVAENDAARILTGELREPESRGSAAAASGPAQGRRLSSVPAQDELPLGDDAIELVREDEETGAAPTSESESGDPETGDPATGDPDTSDPQTSGSGTSGSGTSGSGMAEPPGPGSAYAEDDWMAAMAPAADEAVSPAESVESVPAPTSVDEPFDVPPTEPADGPVYEPADEPAAEVDEPAAAEEPPPVSKRKSRSSVPSWDEIMFGGGKSE